MIEWLSFVVVGKLFIFLGQSIPLPQKIEKIELLRYWHGCDLCFGVWVYAGLSYIWDMNILRFLSVPYVSIVSEFITGGIISFVVHIFSIGWRDKFAPNIVI
jgi:hypothetical protein